MREFDEGYREGLKQAIATGVVGMAGAALGVMFNAPWLPLVPLGWCLGTDCYFLWETRRRPAA